MKSSENISPYVHFEKRMKILRNGFSLFHAPMLFHTSNDMCRLLELGYEKDIAQIITILNTQSSEERQTILLSATLSAGEVIRLSAAASK